MLSNCVNQNHTDKDEQLPYLMITYRSAAHDTKGYFPNYSMLVKEATPPLDIVYDVDVQRKSKIAWLLQERMEKVHCIVR